VSQVFSRLRPRLSFANVTALLALSIALGGTSYAAITLPRNSVGKAQIRARAVGASELRAGAVSSRAVRKHSIGVGKLSSRARRSLRGSAGPAGPAGPPGTAAQTFRAAVPSGGTVQRGNATGAAHQGGTNEYRVTFAADISACIATATLASVPAGSGVDQPAAGRVTVTQDQATSLLVRTFAADGTAAEQPFNVVVAC
jgi:hypothetical protein